MSLVASIHPGSFFDLNRLPGADAVTKSFTLMENILGEQPGTFATAGEWDFEVIRVGGSEFLWMDRSISPPVSRALRLDAYAVAAHTAQRRTLLVGALGRLAEAHAEQFGHVAMFVRNLFWLSLRDPNTSITRITSSSDPALPFAIMFTDKAAQHIPPNTVITGASSRLLAENILHESVHQRISQTILTRKLFAPEYSSQTSPKIEITWRADQGSERNQWWEVDRAFHAAFVYNSLLRFRLTELSRNDLNSLERQAFADALAEGVDAVTYLVSELLRNRTLFTDEGNVELNELEAETGIAVELWQNWRA